MSKLRWIVVLATLLCVPHARSRCETREEPVKLWAAISVPQPVYYGAPSEMERLEIHFAVVNDGNTTVDPKIAAAHFLINGVEPPQWPMVIGNGLRSLN